MFTTQRPPITQQIQNSINFKKSDKIQNNISQGENKLNKITEYKRAAEKMRQNVTSFKNYLSKYEDDGDNQYAYKLVLDFFKYQAITKNLQEETRTIKLNLHRAMRPIDQIKWEQIPQNHFEQSKKDSGSQDSNIFTPIPPKHPSDDEQADSVTPDDILQNSKMIQQLILQKKDKKKLQSKSSSKITHKNPYKIDLSPRYIPNKQDQTQYSDNQVYFDSQESDQSKISLEQSSGQELQQNQNSQEEQQEDEFGCQDSEQYDNMQDFYFDEDYQESLMDEDDFQANNLLKMFSSSRHKKQQSLNRTQYSQMSKQQKQKYFKKLNSDFNRRVRKDTRLPLGSENKKNKRISFDNSVRVKVFNKDAKAADVYYTNQKQQVLVRQIWEYDEQ